MVCIYVYIYILFFFSSYFRCFFRLGTIFHLFTTTYVYHYEYYYISFSPLFASVKFVLSRVLYSSRFASKLRVVDRSLLKRSKPWVGTQCRSYSATSFKYGTRSPLFFRFLAMWKSRSRKPNYALRTGKRIQISPRSCPETVTDRNR